MRLLYLNYGHDLPIAKTKKVHAMVMFLYFKMAKTIFLHSTYFCVLSVLKATPIIIQKHTQGCQRLK